jgi:hypothetical protein
MLSVVMLSVIMLSAVMLSVIMLNVTYKPFVLSIVQLIVIICEISTQVYYLRARDRNALAYSGF